MHDTMVRTQIQLPDAQHRQLKRWAQRRGVSLAEAVRRMVAQGLAAEQEAPSRAVVVREALAVAGRYRDPTGASDVAREHDRYLADADRG
jgi:hypothetical protein